MNGLNKDTKYATLDKWSLLQTLGSGATAKVFLAYDSVARKYAAIKVLKRVDSKTMPYIKNEVKLQQGLNHQFHLKVQNFHESVVLTDADNKSQTVTAIVVDLARGGDILKLIEKIGVFPEPLARTYLHQLVDALECLQQNKITHRDIKPENIMLDEDFCVKVADFGCAVDYSARSQKFRTPAGTSKYFPPEEHMTLPYDGAAADLFATAIVVFAMAVGHMPFGKATETDSLYSMLVKGKAKSFWKAHESILKESGSKVVISSEFKDLMTKMFDPTPSKRMTTDDVKKSAWYKGATLERAEIVKAIKSKRSSAK